MQLNRFIFLHIIFLFLISCVSLNAQTTYTSQAFKFSLTFPVGWKQAKDDNFADRDLNDKERTDLLKKEKSVYLTNFFDFRSSLIAAEVIPKVQMNAVKKKEVSYIDFKKEFIRSAGQLLNDLERCRYLIKPTEVIIDGNKSLYFKIEYDFMVLGKKQRVWNTTYGIPYNGYLIHLSMVDSSGSDRTEEFDTIVKSIKVLQ